jgi:uncharacterized membrane protein YkoI
MKSKKRVVLELSLTIVLVLIGILAIILVTDTAASPSPIDAARAKEIALAHAGLKERDVDFIRVHLDHDDWRREYEVEFYRGKIEYDYDVDAQTGEIVSYSHDAEYFPPSVLATSTPANNQNSTIIGDVKAKEIALSHAGLKESDVAFHRIRLDYDDGRPEYDIYFYDGKGEFDYVLDALTGEIISYGGEERKKPYH